MAVHIRQGTSSFAFIALSAWLPDDCLYSIAQGLVSSLRDRDIFIPDCNVCLIHVLCQALVGFSNVGVVISVANNGLRGPLHTLGSS
jgi:hypothetical protein